MKYRYILILCLIGSMFLKLGQIPFIFEEPRRAEVAMEMIINENYIVPTINDVYYYNKPPLHNWVLAATFQLFSTYSEFAARATTVLSFLLIGLLVFLISRKYLSENAALLAMIFTLTTGDIFYRFSLLAEIDVFYTLIVFLQGMSIIYFWKKRNLWFLFTVSYLFCALGFLTKGPTSLAFQVFSLLGWAIGFGQFKRLFSLQHIAGISVLAALLGVYFFWYSTFHDPFLFISKLLAESSEKTISTGFQLDYFIKWASFPIMFLQVIFPWALLLVLVNRTYINYLKNNEFLKYCFLFIAANILIYWLSPGSRPRYLYPFVPFAMIILGDLADRHLFKLKAGFFIQKIFGGLMITIGLGILIAPFFDLPDAIENPWIIGMVGGLFIAILSYLYFRHSTQRIWIFVSFMITIRIIFDFAIIPVRSEDTLQKMDFKTIATDILDKANGERVWLYAPANPEILKPAFFGVRFPERSHEIIEWPPFQLSYYMAKESNHVLSWKSEKDSGLLFLSDSENLTNHQIEILDTFPITGKGKEFILFRFLNIQ